ncbi:MAG: DUF4382 domain-containing protein [Pseudomonadota bacterium]|nr:MAG: DUF4382 domain-containing protein [Pseudomonadota bacterium]
MLNIFGAFPARIGLVTAAVLALSACGDGSGSAGGGSGMLTLRITDAPVDSATVEHVYVQFSGVELQREGGRLNFYFCADPADPNNTVVSTTPCTTPKARQLDLLALNSGVSATLLDGVTLPAGQYNWIRLDVNTGLGNESNIVVSGTPHALTIPSGDETGLKLNRGFTVATGGHVDFTVDFDLRKSVHMTGGGQYLLRPTLRIVDNLLVGRISGTVASALITTGCTPAVYVYQGANVVPDDIGGSGVEPVTTAMVGLDNSVYRYTAAFLEAGEYTVAFTCQAAADDPAVDNAIGFTGAANVTVAANATTTHNFQ